jgi:hypothetical protein
LRGISGPREALRVHCRRMCLSCLPQHLHQRFPQVLIRLGTRIRGNRGQPARDSFRPALQRYMHIPILTLFTLQFFVPTTQEPAQTAQLMLVIEPRFAVTECLDRTGQRDVVRFPGRSDAKMDTPSGYCSGKPHHWPQFSAHKSRTPGSGIRRLVS